MIRKTSSRPRLSGTGVDWPKGSVITRRSAEELGLKKGDTVTAVVKATEVMIAKP
jgi:molybdopterin-binding protein